MHASTCTRIVTFEQPKLIRCQDSVRRGLRQLALGLPGHVSVCTLKGPAVSPPDTVEEFTRRVEADIQ